MVELGFYQNISQELQINLSPRLLNMLRILSLPYADVVTEIENASEENPFVEIEKHESLTEYLDYLGANKKNRKEIDFDGHPGLENIKGSPKKLHEFLLEQLKLMELDDEDFEIAQDIIEAINNRGYIENYENLKQKICDDFHASTGLVDAMLETIQTFEPEGVGARDLKECLLIQVKEFGLESASLRQVIEKAIQTHLDDLGQNNFQKVAKSLGIPEEGVCQIFDFIKKNLNPNPGSNFGDETQMIVPSFSVEIKEENIKLINLEETYGPKICISADYQKMLKDPKTDKKTVEFLKERLEKAKELVENLRKRGETSQAIMNIIVKTQKDFFDMGPKKLFPLEQKTLADQLGLHPSTISRALAGKYVQTPKGMVPLRFLCQRELHGFSPAFIKAKVLEVISKEDKSNPLSDQEILKIIEKEGIRASRRTIASYRRQLGVMPV